MANITSFLIKTSALI